MYDKSVFLSDTLEYLLRKRNWLLATKVKLTLEKPQKCLNCFTGKKAMEKRFCIMW